MDLAKKHCVPCEGGTPPMARADAVKLLKKLNRYSSSGAQAELRSSNKGSSRQARTINNVWKMLDNAVLKISKKFKFKNFKEALEFVNKVGDIAESEGHHPDISFGWGRAEITLYTHAVSGLSENDFILAAKINKIPN
ncbi:MAG: hypothetical protein A3B44_00720 [Candidatus Levybacteria bacterium RIFCSPLOWO2_01_FULL_38_21]|nr:MAG: hypothetical protein A3B44_00720 [Candidatus Levybacteria bacterium RIFCSPLOWO2_01_FULL_38_21]